MSQVAQKAAPRGGVSLGDRVDLEVPLGRQTRLYCLSCLRFTAGAGSDVVTCRCGTTYRRQPGERIYTVAEVILP